MPKSVDRQTDRQTNGFSALYTVDRENFVVKKVTWNKSSTRFNFVKAESIVCMSTKELR